MTDSTINLRTMPTGKLFISYLIPSALGMVLMAINIFADGLFVSRAVGSEGLAGVNIAVPIYSVLFSISLWFGIGGATLYSIAIGENKFDRARTIFTQTFWLTIIVVSIIIAVALSFQTEIAYLFGANAAILPYAEDYLHVILAFGLIYILENIMSIFVRNDGNPKLAMIALIATSVINIILNYYFLFVLEMGVSGAAYATVIATAIGFFILLGHFLRKNAILRFVMPRFEWQTIRSILAIGLPSFIVEGSAAIVVVAYNITFSHFVGEIGITAFAVVNYMHAVFLMLFIGVGASLQPIVSFHYGAKLYTRLKVFLSLGIKTGLGVGVTVLAIGWLGSDVIIAMFDITDPTIAAYTRDGIVLFFIGYLFLGINMVYAEYFQSIKKIRLATLIILSRSIGFFLPLLWLLPTFFSSHTIWLAFPLAEALAVLVLWLVNTKALAACEQKG